MWNIDYPICLNEQVLTDMKKHPFIFRKGIKHYETKFDSNYIDDFCYWEHSYIHKLTVLFIGRIEQIHDTRVRIFDEYLPVILFPPDTEINIVEFFRTQFIQEIFCCPNGSITCRSSLNSQNTISSLLSQPPYKYLFNHCLG